MSSQELRNRLRNALREIKFSQELQNLIDHTTGSIFYVDSVGGQAANTGQASDEAVTTLTLAIALCTAGKGDIIYLMPKHNENIGNAQIDIDKDGITIIGLGHGAQRPRFDFDNANSSINIKAKDVVMRNITFLPSVTDVLIAIDIETLQTGTLLDGLEALVGEDGAGVDDFASFIELKVGCDQTIIRNCRVRQHASGAGYISCVLLNGASDDIVIEDCDFKILGAGAEAPIYGTTTLSTNVVIARCVLTSDAEPGIKFVSSTTGTIEFVHIFSDVTNIDDSIEATGMANFENYWVELGDEAGTLIKTPSIDG